MKRKLLILSILGLIVVITFFIIGRDDKIIRVATIGHYTQTNSTYDIDAYRAIEVAIDMLNREKIRYELYRYDLSDVNIHGQIKSQLSHDDIDVLLGPSSTSTIEPMVEELSALDIPVFLIAASNDSVSHKKDNMFRLSSRLSSQTQYMVDSIEDLDIKTVTIYYDTDNPFYAKPYGELIFESLTNSGVTVERYEIGDLSQIKTKELIESHINDELMVMILGPGKAGIVVEHVSTLTDQTIFMLPSWANSEITLEYVRDVKNDIYSLSLSEPKYADAFNGFVKVLKEEKSVEYGPFAYFGYETAYFMDYIYTEIGTMDLDVVQAYIHDIDTYVGEFADYQFDDSGDGERGFSLMKIVDGAYVKE